MEPKTPTSPCDRLLIYAVILVVLACIGVSAALAWHGQSAVIAAFMALAGNAIGILSPSPLKQHSQGGATSQVDAPRAETVNISQSGPTTPPVAVVPVEPPAEETPAP